MVATLSKPLSGSGMASSLRKGVQLHAFAAKLPDPKKTGNQLIDSDRSDKTQMLRELLSECLNDLDHVPPLFAKLRDRQRFQGTADDLEFSDVKMFRNLSVDFLVNFITARSDLTVDDV
eukprot:4490463-Alexandrium_andersonii.AAC.1